MNTPLILLRCTSCDHTLRSSELDNYDIFDGFCEGCYGISMNAAYDEDELNDIKDLLGKR